MRELSGRLFEENANNLGLISARLNESGADLDGIRKMVDRQCRLWKGSRMAEFLRPKTIFGKEKFGDYYAARDQPVVLTDQPSGKHDRSAGTYNALRTGQYDNVGKNLNPEPPPT